MNRHPPEPDAARPGLRAVIRRERPLIGLVALASLLYAGYAVLEHLRFETGLDLGFFNQAIWHYSRFEEPAVTARALDNLLGEHFHPILATLAPLYWIWPDPAMLLVAQGVLIAVSIVPVFAFAEGRLGRTPAYLIAVAYAAFWGIWTAVGFEFHEVAFAPLLIALAIYYGDARRWVPFFVAIALLLLVKENMAILVAFFGIWLVSQREWARGAATFVLGIVWYLAATKVFIPHFSDERGFVFWTYQDLGEDLPSAIGNMVRSPTLLFETLLSDGEKIATTLLLVVPFLGLCLCSRVALLAVPLVLERMLSSNDNLWGTSLHYSLAIAPVLAIAAAAGLANVASRLPRARDRVVAVAAAAMAAAGLLTAELVAAPASSVGRLAFGSASPTVAALGDAIDRVPRDASVVAPQAAYPHLSAREVASVVSPLAGPTDYILHDVMGRAGAVEKRRWFQRGQAVVISYAPRYLPLLYRDGLLLLRRRTGPGEGGGLRRMPAEQYAAWEPAYRDWLSAGGRLNARLAKCDPAAAPDCLDAPRARLRARTGKLAARLSSLTRLPGGCGQFAATVLEGLRLLDAPLAELRRQIAERDPIGRVALFHLACRPQGADEAPPTTP